MLMRIWLLCGLCLWGLLWPSGVYAASFDELWKQVRSFEQAGEVKSAYALVGQIEEKARTVRHKGQWMAAMLYGCKLRQCITPDSFYTDMLRLERLKQVTPDAVQRAVVASVLGELYADNAKRNRNSKGKGGGLEKMREWPYARFREASLENYTLSLADPELLATVKAAEYMPFVEIGEDADFFDGDLLHVIGRRAVWARRNSAVSEDLQWTAACCAKMLHVYRARGNREAELWIMLDSLAGSQKEMQGIGKRFVHEAEQEDVERKTLASGIYREYCRLLERFGDLPMAAEVYLRMMDLTVTAKRKIGWAEEGLRKHASYPRAKLLRLRKEALVSPEFKAYVNETLYPGRTFNLRVNYRNVPEVELRWYRMPKGVRTDSLNVLKKGGKLAAFVRKHGRKVKSSRWALKPGMAYEKLKDTLKVQVPDLGTYVLCMCPENVPEGEENMGSPVNVSRLKAVALSLPDSCLQCRVMEGMSGAPVEDAEVEVFVNGRIMACGKTDCTGKFVPRISAAKLMSDRIVLHVAKGEDCHLVTSDGRMNYAYVNHYAKPEERVELYTDRAIYRPGQTVRVAGWCLRFEGDDERVRTGKKLKLILKDSKRKLLAERHVASDEMGTVAEDFQLPVSCPSGSYRVECGEGYCTFKVEEYKRPTFEVEIGAPQVKGDTAWLAGEVRRFTGETVRHARVTGTSAFRSWVSALLPSERKAKSLDTVYTDEKGGFVLAVPLDVEGNHSKRGAYREVTVQAMDAAGETRTVGSIVPLSSRMMRMSLVMPYYWNREKLHGVEVKLYEANGGAYVRDSVSVTCSLVRWVEGRRDTLWMERPIQPNRKVCFSDMEDLPSGEYEMQARAVAGQDTVAARARTFVLFGKDDVRPVNGETGWFYCERDTIFPNRPARIHIGSAAKNVTLFYTLFRKNEVLVDTFYTFSDSILTFTYPQQLDYGETMDANFYFVKGLSVYHYQCDLKGSHPSKSLRMEWVSFRDRLQPGREETWRLKVSDAEGRPVKAQVMAVLYDASLDDLRHHDWGLPRRAKFSYLVASFNSFYNDSKRFFYEKEKPDGNILPLSFGIFGKEYLDWRETMERVRKVSDPEDQIYDIVETSPAAWPEISSNGVGMDEKKRARPIFRFRSDLNETAFFYPRLMTDSCGLVEIPFKLPEALTSWRFMALAHTEDMMTGKFVDEAVAVKEVMAELRLPRFVRVGDRATISASLRNLTEKEMRGEVTMEVLDPHTGDILWTETRAQQLWAGSDTVVDFIYVPSGENLCPICRVMFKAGGFGDGEQRSLTILEDKEELTQTLPFVISHKGDTVIHLDDLFQGNQKKADRRRLTVEYTANPLWYAVKTLPCVLESDERDALSLAAAYYASALSVVCVERYPQIRALADLWSNQADSLSGNVFDAERQKELMAGFSRSLRRLQKTDGSFGWFRGMTGSLHVTLYVAKQWFRAAKVGREANVRLVSFVDVKAMMEYLIREMRQDLHQERMYMESNGRSLYGSAHWADYLYVATLAGLGNFGDEAKKELHEMVGLLMRDKARLPLYERAEAAVVLRRMGRDDEAAQLVRSIREHLVDGAEGLHLEYPSNGFVGSDRKLAVHTLLMEALALAGGADKAEADGLCRWLLSQKRVQDWGTSTATMDAVYALLQGQGQDLTLQTGDEVRLESPKGEEWAVLQTSRDGLSGLGTVSATVEGRELDGGAGILRVTKSAETPSAWGAAYAQFRLPLSEVESAASGLRVRVEADNRSPRVGDRLTLRYVLTSDRDYEYVRLKAGRAACLEPVEALSGYAYRNGLGYYREVKDASTEYFFERLPKGTYVLEMECYVERPGRYTVGAAKLNGVYAPEFSAYGAGMTLDVRP